MNSLSNSVLETCLSDKLILKEAEMWCGSVSNWLQILCKTYLPCYKDVLSGFCSGFIQVNLIFLQIAKF